MAKLPVYKYLPVAPETQQRVNIRKIQLGLTTDELIKLLLDVEAELQEAS